MATLFTVVGWMAYSTVWDIQFFRVQAKYRFVFQVPVSRWGRLDASAPFDEFARGGSVTPLV